MGYGCLPRSHGDDQSRDVSSGKAIDMDPRRCHQTPDRLSSTAASDICAQAHVFDIQEICRFVLSYVHLFVTVIYGDWFAPFGVLSHRFVRTMFARDISPYTLCE